MRVCLTFDDGPHPSNTGLVLDVLRDYGISAGFFLLGERLNSQGAKKVLERQIYEGHTVGSHGFHHVDLTKLSETDLMIEVGGSVKLIKSFGAECLYFRPPFGNFNRAVIDMAKDNGCKTILWNVDTKDWLRKSMEPSVIVKSIVNNCSTSVVIMHDIYYRSHKNLSALIAALSKENIEFVGLDEIECCEAKCHG